MRYFNGRNRITKGSSGTRSGSTLPPPSTPLQLSMKNNAAIRLEIGYIVRLDESEAYAVTTFNNLNPFQPNPFGIVVTASDPSEMVNIAYAGVVEVAMDNALVNVGDFLYNSATPGLLTRSNDAFTGAIGRALTAKSFPAKGSVMALVGYMGRG